MSMEWRANRARIRKDHGGAAETGHLVLSSLHANDVLRRCRASCIAFSKTISLKFASNYR
jgi:hypothetical protein